MEEKTNPGGKGKKMNLSRINKVVTVYDEQKAGKTTMLCELCLSLLQQYPSADFVLRRKGSRQKLKVPPIGKGGKYQDILFAIKFTDVNGVQKMVGIGSAGDDRDSVLRNFMFFDSVWPELNFDCVFVAVRRQHRSDGLGDCNRSFALMQLEELEQGMRAPLSRPFVAIPKNINKQIFVNQLMAMIP